MNFTNIYCRISLKSLPDFAMLLAEFPSLIIFIYWLAIVNGKSKKQKKTKQKPSKRYCKIQTLTNSAPSQTRPATPVLLNFQDKSTPLFFLCLSICQKFDSSRIAKSRRKSSAGAKQRSKTLRAIKKGFQDEKQTEEGTTYAK